MAVLIDEEQAFLPAYRHQFTILSRRIGRAGRALGTPDLTVALDYSGTGRSVVIESGTDWGEAVIANLTAPAGAGDQDFSPRI